MSAFLATIDWSGRPADRDTLAAANACVRYRCPDGEWIWAEGAVGLAQASLATLPEDQPGLPVAAGNCRIVASCRVDNRAELRRYLPPGLLPDSATDAAYILAAYRHWGDACVERLVGDFAFVIWDAGRRRILAARDIAGARQLFYYHSGQRLILASERTQILQDPAVPFAIDEEQIAEFLTPTFQWTSGWDQGMLRGLHVLQAGELLQASADQFAIRRFWEWRDRAPDARPAPQVLEEYLHTLEQAVRCRLRSRAARVGVELSGGLDSPAIASLAARVAPPSAELHSFSHVFDELPAIDERPRIDAVLRRYPQLQPHFLAADRLQIARCFTPGWQPASVYAPQEITGGISGLQMYEQIARLGCRVVLTGELGDTVNDGFGGVYYDLLRRGRFGEIARRFAGDWRESPRRALGALAYYGLLPIAPWPLLAAGRQLLDRRRGPYCQLPEFFAPELSARIGAADRALRVVRRWHTSARSPVAQQTLDHLRPTTVVCGLPQPYPIEFRHPYTDRRLIELVLAMPQELKWQPNAGATAHARARWHHRRAMRGILPDEVRVANPSVDFTPALAYSMPPGYLRGWLLDAPTIHVVERGYVVREQLLAWLADDAGYHYYVQAALALEAWLRLAAPGGAIARLVPARLALDLPARLAHTRPAVALPMPA